MSRKALDHIEDVLDMITMGSAAEKQITRLAADIFIATQTEEKLKRDQIKGKQQANQTYYDIGKKVRKTIEEIGGILPENLPVADSMKTIEKSKDTKPIKTPKKKQ